MIIARVGYRQGTPSYYPDRLREKNFRQRQSIRGMDHENCRGHFSLQSGDCNGTFLQHQLYNIFDKRSSLT